MTAYKLIGDNKRYERWRWQIFGISWLAYFGFYLTRKSFAVAKIGIVNDSNIDLSISEMGWIDGGYLTAYAIGQIFWGIAGDRVGTRKVILIGMLVSVITAIAMGASSITIAFGVFFVIQGLAQSSGWAPLVKNVAYFFSQRERGRIMGLWCTNYAFGGMIASILAGYLGDKYGWRFSFFVPAATLLLIWCLFFIFQRNRPRDVGLDPIETYHDEPEAVIVKEELSEEQVEKKWGSILHVLKSKNVLTLGVVYFLLKPTRYSLLFWGPKYIYDKLGTGMSESGLISSFFELAGIISVFFAGYISDKVFGSRRMPVVVICLMLLGIFVFFLDDLPATRLSLSLSLMLIGLLLFGPDSIVSGTAAIDFGTKKGASTAAGIINSMGSVGAIVGGTIPGLLLERWGWNGVFSFLGILLFIAGSILIPKWNTVPISTNV